jgi:hypothetical protein
VKVFCTWKILRVRDPSGPGRPLDGRKNRNACRHPWLSLCPDHYWPSIVPAVLCLSATGSIRATWHRHGIVSWLRERETAWRCQRKEVHKSQKNANTARHTNNQLHPTARTRSQTPENRQPVEAVNSAAWHAPLEMIQLRERHQLRTTSWAIRNISARA